MTKGPLRLDEIAFRGYKAFPGGAAETDELQRLTLAPLTLVFGKNNSGKSAVVRLPRLLLGGLACSDERILPLEVRGLKYGGRFVDIIHGGDFFRRPTFEILAQLSSERLALSATLYVPSALDSDKPQIWSYKMREPEGIDLQPPTSKLVSRMSLGGLLPADPRWDRWRDAASALLDEMVHLGPMRAVIQPSYVEEQPEKLGLDGRQAPQWLRADPEMVEAVGAWFEKHMDGWRLSLSQSNESFHLRVGMNKAAMATNLAQAGEGLQQVLPVVLHQIWRQRPGSGTFLDVVEQPELHLHAAAQAPLADLFIATALQGRGSVLVETHSQPLLLRVQRRVAEGELPHDHVALYFVDVTTAGSQLRRIGLRPNGEVDWWPAGVFEEDFHEVAAMNRAQRRRSASGERR